MNAILFLGFLSFGIAGAMGLGMLCLNGLERWLPPGDYTVASCRKSLPLE